MEEMIINRACPSGCPGNLNRDAENVRLNGLLADLRKLVDALESEAIGELNNNHRDSERGGYANGLDTAADRLDDLLDKYDS